jgi:predicted dehydrogenase
VFHENDARGPLARFLTLLHFGNEGTRFCPTLEDAVTRHRMLDAIETAAATGQRQTLG